MSEMLTAKQVMARLKLGRTTVYGLGRRYLETGGAEGWVIRRSTSTMAMPSLSLSRDARTRCDGGT